MTIDLGTPDRGCLLFADITGYTDYLQGTELMHAQDVLADLLENIVNSIQPVFRLSKLEGDAAFAFADRDSVTPSRVMDTVEAAYFSFKRRLRDIVHSTTCECNACVLTPSLDLKFFIHSGEYVVRSIAGTEELTGPDVVLVHRLAKGSAAEAVGTGAYAVYTSATLEAMSMNPEILGFVKHTETFHDVGDVTVYIQDLATRWLFEQERHRDIVTSAEASFERAMFVPAPPAVIWDYLTDPAKRIRWQAGTTSIDMVTEGRAGPGSINHCAHGPDVVVEHVVDWRPFSHLTVRYESPDWKMTTLLEVTEGGTSVTVRAAFSDEKVWAMMKDQFVPQFDANGATLAGLLSEHVAAASA